MRIILVLVLLTLSLACSGGDDYAPAGGGTPAAGGDPGAAAPPADAPKPQVASPEATELMNVYNTVKDLNDPALVLPKAAPFEGRTLPGDAYYFLGMIYQKGQDWAKGAAAFQSFLEKSPGDKNEKWGLYRLVDCLSKAGRAAEAGPYIDTFGRKFPDETKYWRSMESTLAATLAGEGDLEKAATHYGKALDLGDYYAGEEYVTVLWALGRYDEARTAAGKLGTAANDAKEQERAKVVAARAEKLGKTAPELDIESWVNPEEFDLESTKGKVVLIYFWSTGGQLGQVRKLEASLTTLWNKFQGEGLVMFGISKHDQFNLIEGKKDEAMGTAEEVQNLRNWVFNLKTAWPLALVASEANHTAYGYAGIIPTFVVLGKDGHYRFYRQGHAEEGYKLLDAVIGRLLKE